MDVVVAALYIDPRGPYPGMSGVECWGIPESDAIGYPGPHPVVAHPPCGPWGQLAHLCTKQDRRCGPAAVAAVRSYGGVLEHPAYSKLWKHCCLPRPGELPDRWGGKTIEVEQVRWGHVARKRTWLYLVGVTDVGEQPPPKEPTHWVSGSRNLASRQAARVSRGYVPHNIKIASAQQRRRTPPAFAEYLVWMARQAANANQ